MMEYSFPYLSLMIFTPMVGALVLILFCSNKDESKRNAKWIALFFSIITLLLAIICTIKADFYNQSAYGVYKLTENYVWFKNVNISYRLGVDGISWPFILLTTLLIPLCILCSWENIHDRFRDFLIVFLILETFILGVFSALDLVLFYIFFEAMLIPMYLIIGIWGGEHRIYAAIKFFLYTLAGSILFLVAIIFIFNRFETTDIVQLPSLVSKLDLSIQKYLWLAMFAAFAVKIPMWPVHTWLPDAHVQAPTAGSVILAGILLKLGGYGFIRFSLPMLPLASEYYASFVMVLSCIAIIYASFVAFSQTDMKKLVAYSSIAHMGYVTMGIFSFNKHATDGAIVQMISHGIISAALFLVVGILYDRAHTKEIAKFGGVAEKMPIFAICFMIFTLASIGLPGTSGFVGEFLTLIGVFEVSKIFSFLAATGMVFGAVYMLVFYRKIMFGKTNANTASFTDITSREIIILVPLIFLAIFIGIYSPALTNMFDFTTTNLVETLNYYK